MVFREGERSLGNYCFTVTGLFSRYFVRLTIPKLIYLPYAGFVVTCLNVDVLMGVYVLL